MRLTVEDAFQKYGDRVFSAAFSICRNREDADDVVQDTFLRYHIKNLQYMDETHLREADEVVFSFSKAGAFILFGYFMLKLIDMLVQANLPYLCTGYGLWWLVEMLFFVLTPALLYAKGSRDRNIKLCRFASANAVLGIVLNRFNVSMIAFNYALPADERYFPSIWEVCISIFVVTLIVTVYRFIVYHMPVLYEHPDFKDAH